MSDSNSRRDFLTSSALLFTAASLPLPSWSHGHPVPNEQFRPLVENNPRWPIMQGLTDQTSASFTILHPQDARFGIRFLDPQKRPLLNRWIDRFDIPETKQAISESFVMGLIPGLDYRLQIIAENGQMIDERIFRSLDVTRSTCRFAAVSCMNDIFSDKSITMWQALARESLDFVFFIGDTCYADNDNETGTETGLRRRYAETRNRLAWFRSPRLTPCFATWDDHDYGVNNGDRTFRLADFTRHMFRKFWGSAFRGLHRPAFGIGSVFEGFGQRFYLMDDRSYRERNGGQHWGSEQKEWLLAELARSPQPAWILNGSQFFGGYLGKDSFEGNHNADFRDFIAKLARVPAPVTFVAGDVHFSEVMRIEPQILGYETREFTSSSMHSFTFPLQQHRARNPRRLESEWRHNFLVFESDVGQDWRILTRCVTEGNAVSFTHAATIKR